MHSPSPLIAGFELFNGLPSSLIEALMQSAETRRLERGGVLWQVGEQSKGLFLIISGRLRFLSGTRRVVLGVALPGEFTGEGTLFGGGPYIASAVASEATEYVLIPKGTIEEALRASPELALRLIGRMAQRTRQLASRVDETAAVTVRARVARHLLARSQRNGGRVSLGMTQRELAEELGTMRETIVKEMSVLVRRGCLERIGRGVYAITDRGELMRLAAEDAE